MAQKLIGLLIYKKQVPSTKFCQYSPSICFKLWGFWIAFDGTPVRIPAGIPTDLTDTFNILP
jgi:hypothetical protein